MKKIRNKQIGVVAVDSGQLILVDPCYLDKWKSDEFEGEKKDADFSYSGACTATLNEDKGGQLHDGKFKEVAVAFSTGYGDGVYPVYTEYNDKGRITAISVIFN